MHWKITNLKFTIKVCVLSLLLGGVIPVQAQDSTQAGSTLLAQAQAASDSTNNAFQPYKIDGVAAVVGKYLVLESDIKKRRLSIQQQMPDNKNITNCDLIVQLMQNRLFAHAALQDSTVFKQVTDPMVRQRVNQQIQILVKQLGSMEKVVKYYRKNSETELRDELFKIDKTNMLSRQMEEKITNEVTITPEEVHQFFTDIPKDKRPKIGDEVEIAQLVIKPKVPESEIKKTIAKLNEIRNDVLENGASFVTKAVLNSDDKGTASNGGRLVITRDSPLDKNFKQVAFSLREGEISKPFKSAFGYHIIQVEKVLGQKRIIRHILLIPKLTQKSLENARKRIDSIRTFIVDGKMTFTQAAKRFSDDDKTRGDGGQLINSETGDTRFNLTRLPSDVYSEVKRLKEGEVSDVMLKRAPRTERKYYKIISVTGFYPEHVADYAKDYTKIKQLALNKKKIEAIQKWQKKEIENTYIKIGNNYKDCKDIAKWLKKQ